MNGFFQTAAIAIALFLFGAALERYRLRAFSRRRCTGAAWRRAFPHAPRAEIRLFLDLLVSAFAFSESKRLCFAPEDRVLSIYRALYPHRNMVADALEFETFVGSVQEHFGVDLLPAWREDITLGELFARATRAAEP